VKNTVFHRQDIGNLLHCPPENEGLAIRPVTLKRDWWVKNRAFRGQDIPNLPPCPPENKGKHLVPIARARHPDVIRYILPNLLFCRPSGY
jgi:hypothetical protein